VGVAQVSPRSVRISLTDRCDLACVYCRPHKQDGYFEATMAMDAWATMLAGLKQSGVNRVRITGGEPLLYPRIVEFVAELSRMGFSDVALTTNATRLLALAGPLKAAGLQRINVSIDSLRPATFARLTRGGKLEQVLRGIDAAVAAGFHEIKLNTVVVRAENDDELGDLVRWAWARGITPRFLEIMAIGEGAAMQDQLVSYGEMRALIAPLLADDAPKVDPDRGPARYIRSKDGVHRVGFITGTSDTYCKGCDRLRVAADGTLRPCLATNDGVSASAEAAAGDLRGVQEALGRAWAKKPDGDLWKGCTETTAKDVSIRKIGG
jgi:cyclic pyranopterin phosphate synthase